MLVALQAFEKGIELGMARVGLRINFGGFRIGLTANLGGFPFVV